MRGAETKDSVMTCRRLQRLACVLVAAMAANGPSMHSQAAEGRAAELAASEPGPQHRTLWSRLGGWDVSVRIVGSDGKARIGKGEAVVRSRLGGTFVQQTLNWIVDGTEFQEFTLLGFDRATEKFTSFRIDSFSTGHVCATGEYDSVSHAVVEFGSAAGVTGPRQLKIVTKFVNESLIERTSYEVLPDGDRERMLVRFTKRPAPN